MDLIILAGGRATRLGQQTQSLPKILLRFNGETFLDHQLDSVIDFYDNVIYSLGHLAEEIIPIINRHKYKNKLNYVIDSQSGCGTGAAIMNCLPRVSQKFSVIYGDSFLLCDHSNLQNEFLKSGKSCGMVLCKAEGFDQNNVRFEGNIIKDYDKSRLKPDLNYLDYGLNFFDQLTFSGFKDKKVFDLSAIHQEYIRRNDICAISITDRYYEIGSLVGQSDFVKYLNTQLMEK